MSTRPLSLVVLLAACSSGGAITPALDLAPAAPDQAAPAADLGRPGDLTSPQDQATPDLAPTPTPAQCLEGWRMYNGACPAPIITESYVANGCVGTSGWFIDGANFQLEQRNMGIADYGPQSFGANGNQKHWNVITPTRLCVTVAAGAAGTWVGKTIYVKNPDGKTSNSVVVSNRL